MLSPLLGVAAASTVFGIALIASGLSSSVTGTLAGQVILGLQLPFAVVPLLWFTTRRKHLGAYAFAPLTGVVLWSVALALILINVWVIHELS